MSGLPTSAPIVSAAILALIFADVSINVGADHTLPSGDVLIIPVSHSPTAIHRFLDAIHATEYAKPKDPTGFDHVIPSSDQIIEPEPGQLPTQTYILPLKAILRGLPIVEKFITVLG